jgi:hypothetical protein
MLRRSGANTKSADAGILTVQLPEPAMAMGLLAGVGMLAGLGRRKMG